MEEEQKAIEGNPTKVYTKVDINRELVECNVRLVECNRNTAEHNCRLAEYHDDNEEEEKETIDVNLRLIPIWTGLFANLKGLGVPTPNLDISSQMTIELGKEIVRVEIVTNFLKILTVSSSC